MARDGSGNYSLPQAAFSSGTTIESAKVNSDFSDIASALTQSISKDGQTTYTASQPMGGFKLTGLGAGSGAGESIRYDEFRAAFRSFLVGLGMSNNASPNTKVDVAAGSWTEVGQATVLANVAGTIDCGTTGANGLDAGSLANSTWYHAYAIGKTDLTTAFLASTSASSPTMPSGYTLKRCIGRFKTDGSAHIRAFIQDGDRFLWSTQVTETPLGNGSLVLLGAPLGVATTAIIIGTVSTGAGSGSIAISPVGLTWAPQLSAGASGNTSGMMFVKTDILGQVSFAFVGAVTSSGFVTVGWIDRRGRDD